MLLLLLLPAIAIAQSHWHEIWLLLSYVYGIAMGALVLAWSFGQYMPFGEALFNGVFHAVSAFNNAGFDLFTTSLITYNTNPVVVSCVMLLLTIGGMGVLVWLNIINHGWQVSKWSLHTKIVMLTSALLLVLGSLLVFVFEYRALAFADFTLGEKILNSIFQSVTSRTAGFFSVNMTSLTTATIMLMVVLMFIGASPGSTGGGIKTTTFALFQRVELIAIADVVQYEKMNLVTYGENYQMCC
jgi:trk system potassium uptake protein TrkH